MKIFLFTVNHKKPNWLEQEQNSYRKRLPAYIHLSEQSITPSNKQKEAQTFLKLTDKINNKNLIKVALCIQGKQLSSEQLAQQIELWQKNTSTLVFYIGGADGLDEGLTQYCHMQWSLSALTFSHLIAQLVFSEQLYRAFSILQGHPYHLSH